MKICKVKGCELKSRTLEMCITHYTRFKRTGHTDKTYGIPNKITKFKNYSNIHLYGGLLCKIDNEDIDIVNTFVWSYSVSNGVIYQITKDGKNKHIKIHRLIMKAPVGMVVDHINGDKLDNRKRNLRILKNWQNLINQKSRPLRNIEKHYAGKYCVRMAKAGKRYYFGHYNSLEEAIQVRDEKAKELHGDLRRR